MRTDRITGEAVSSARRDGQPPKWQLYGRRPVLAALAPAIAVSFGSAGVNNLLILSQVILGLQLPFVVTPRDRAWAG